MITNNCLLSLAGSGVLVSTLRCWTTAGVPVKKRDQPNYQGDFIISVILEILERLIQQTTFGQQLSWNKPKLSLENWL